MLVTDQSGEPWLTEGTVKVSPADPYALILMTALAQATEKLTKAHVHLADIMEFSVVKADLPAKGGDEVAGANDVRQGGCCWSYQDGATDTSDHRRAFPLSPS